MYLILSQGHWIKVDSAKKNSLVWRTGRFLLNNVSGIGEDVYQTQLWSKEMSFFRESRLISLLLH